MFKEIDAYIQESHWRIWQRKDVKGCVEEDGKIGRWPRTTTEIVDNICWALNTATLNITTYCMLDTVVISL